MRPQSNLLDPDTIREMWDSMHDNGYFERHILYQDWADLWGETKPDDDPLEPEIQHCEQLLRDLDWSRDDIVLPVEYSLALERAIKRSESVWLPGSFPFRQTATALDFGCGFGRSLLWMRDLFDTCIGIDIAGHAIVLAERIFKDDPSVQLYVSDGQPMPASIPHQSIGFIYCFTVFQHIPREMTRAILPELERLLAPGGQLVFNLYSGVNETLTSGEYGTEWAIGYSRDQTDELIGTTALNVNSIKTWSVTNSPAYWTWVELVK